jgi:hypothetical protein
VLLTEQACIASNDLLAIAELPTTRAWHGHHLAAIKNRHHDGGRVQ